MVALGLAAAAVAGVLELTDDDSSPAATGSPASSRRAAQPSASPSQTLSTPTPTPAATQAAPATTQPPTATTTAPGGEPASQVRAGGAAVPAGFRLHTDPTGFRIAVPEGWRRTTEGPRTYFRDPGSGRYLQVDQTTEPKADAVADWKNQEGSVSRRLSGYDRIRIERVDYRGWNAADWEFTWNPGSGRLHVLSRNIRVSDEQAYALYWSVPAGQWAASRPYFDTFAATFQPRD